MDHPGVIWKGFQQKFLPSLLVDVTVSHCLSKLTNDVSGDDP